MRDIGPTLAGTLPFAKLMAEALNAAARRRLWCPGTRRSSTTATCTPDALRFGFRHDLEDHCADKGDWVVAYHPDAHAVDVLDEETFERDFEPSA